MAYADSHPGYSIDNEEQAKNFILELVKDVEQARAACDVIVPDNQQLSQRQQIKAYRIFLVKHGSALGALMALHRAGRCSDVAYNELRERVIQTLAPTIVGVVRGP